LDKESANKDTPEMLKARHLKRANRMGEIETVVPAVDADFLDEPKQRIQTAQAEALIADAKSARILRGRRALR
jgi:hypothetical protein